MIGSMSNPKIYIVTGISGSGKTTVARVLNERREIAFDSKINAGLYNFVDETGNVSREQRWNDSDWRAKYKWSLNRKMLETLIMQNKSAKQLFLCGRANIYQYWDIADKIFLLKVNASTLQKRLNNESRDNQFAKDTSTQRKLIENLESIQQNLIKHGAIVIDAERDIDHVVRQILNEAE
jgi:thymidylate kinase